MPECLQGRALRVTLVTSAHAKRPGRAIRLLPEPSGSVAAIAREVTDVLKEKGYKVRVQDYDFRPGASFIEKMHEAIKNRSSTRSATIRRLAARFSAAGSRPSSFAANTFCAATRA
jgi:hypothetical protein